MTTRSERAAHVGLRLDIAAAIGAAVVLFAVGRTANGPLSPHGDTAALVKTSAVMDDCLRHLQLWNCDAYLHRPAAGRNPLGVFPFPLFQYVPALIMRFFDASFGTTFRTLVFINFASLSAIVAIAYFTMRRVASAVWAPVVVASVLASPLIWYGKSAFGEDFAAALVLAAIAAILMDAPLAIIGMAVAAACLTKETNPPFVFALAALCVIGLRRGDAAGRRRQLIVIGSATGVGILCNSLFNVFRWGTIRNVNYTQRAFHTTNPQLIMRIFSAEWFAPNAGLIWFWPTAVALILLCAFCSLRHTPRNSRSVGAPAVALLLILQMFVLATWYSPFGWLAWGPRLILPLLPAMIVASCALAAPFATRALSRFLRSAALFPATAVVILAGLPQVAEQFYGHAVTKFFSPRCGYAGDEFTNQKLYYHCVQTIAWGRQPWMLSYGLRGVTTTWGVVVSLAFAVAITALLLRARNAARAEPGDDTVLDVKENPSPVEST